jgi:homoserine kinase type II
MNLSDSQQVVATLLELGELLNTTGVSQENRQMAISAYDKLSRHLRIVQIEQAVVDVLNHHYNLGEIISISQLFGGYVNQSFAVVTQNGKERKTYFVRRYKQGIMDNEVKLEHSYIQHICQNGIHEAANIIEAQPGITFVKSRVAHVDQEDQESVFAVYDFLIGEDRYTWDHPHCNKGELKNAVSLMARIHGAGCGYDATRFAREEPKILDMLHSFLKDYQSLGEIAKKSPNPTTIDSSLLSSLPLIQEAIGKSLDSLDPPDLPMVMIHGDYHPGNVKFIGEEISGVFDFDWCKMETRLFDVACSIIYYCAIWEGKEDGTLVMDHVDHFLKSYQAAAKQKNNMGPLSEDELKALPGMIQAGNLYILYWGLSDYFSGKEINLEEYSKFSQHSINLINTVDRQWDELAEISLKHRV